MKTSYLLPLVALIAASPGFAAAGEAAPRAFETPRIKAGAAPGDANVIPKTKTKHDELVPGNKGGVTKGRKQNLDYLAIDGGSSWATEMHGHANETTFASFLVYASVGTVIDVAGAKVMIRAGAGPEAAQLYLGTAAPSGVAWQKFGGPVKFEKHSGKMLAALPILTVRADPVSREWDLYVANRLAIYGLQLKGLPNGAPKLFSISAGANGAWLCGLISSEENPIYPDSNRNGIEDEFEKRQRGGAVLGATDTAADRKQVAQLWQQDQRARSSRPWPVARPLPDDTDTTPPVPKKKS